MSIFLKTLNSKNIKISRNKGIGENDALILSVVFEKEEIENTDFDSLPDASDYIKKYDNHMSFTQTKGFGEVESLLKKLDA